MTLAEAYATLTSGSLWSSTGKCKGFAVQNPGEAAKITAYVAALSAGQAPPPPALTTATGRGIVGMLAALAGPAPAPPSQLRVTITGTARQGSKLTAAIQ